MVSEVRLGLERVSQEYTALPSSSANESPRPSMALGSANHFLISFYRLLEYVFST